MNSARGTTTRTYRSPLRREQAQLTRRQILDAASRLFVSEGYRGVTVENIAAAAGVAPQTIYATFKTKLAIAQGIIWSSFETEGIYELLKSDTRATRELVAHLDVGARIARRLNERFAVIAQFMRESGDSALLAEYQKIEDLRFEQIEREVAPAFRNSHQLRAGVSPRDAIAAIWALTGTDLYYQFVIRRHWTPARYEAWLKDALIQTLVDPAVGATHRRSK